jgi:hypothetical protein
MARLEDGSRCERQADIGGVCCGLLGQGAKWEMLPYLLQNQRLGFPYTLYTGGLANLASNLENFR